MQNNNAILSESGLHNMSALALAYIGDAVYELLARTAVCKTGKRTAESLHTATVSIVQAPAQARAARRIISLPQEDAQAPAQARFARRIIPPVQLLSEAEQAIFRRGRNARVRAVPRGASFEEYHLATAIEALFGYLYLKGETARIKELFEAATAPDTED
ncbi:MAG: ribonuclease III [Oscillospiraceae bacterium]|jgi:ribonuclease-3 family protein|nr:ribonuclease III [Oscillospiraceae bacterium]